MRPSQTPRFPWERVSIDFVGPLPVTKRGFNSFMSVICNLTCMCHLVPCKTTDTASDVARRFLRDVVRLHGLPETLVSDRDVRFTSKFWKSLWIKTDCSSGRCGRARRDGSCVGDVWSIWSAGKGGSSSTIRGNQRARFRSLTRRCLTANTPSTRA